MNLVSYSRNLISWKVDEDCSFWEESSKSNISKDASLDKKTSITLNTQSNDLAVDSTVMSTPVSHISNINGEQSQLELEQAATKAQTAFRGYLVPLKKENGQISMVPLFQSHKSIAGVISVDPMQGKKVEHNGIKIELLGQIGATSMTLPLLFVNWMFLVKYMKGKHFLLNFLQLKCLMRHTMVSISPRQET
ncbi:unnamed protein product [Lactuca saligna]|uniref:Uncharacterized protein n=1 Tax=Lactuca saligna TaxID=75948 RepID=A0AA35VYA0_LACSI|nr:unnamed protein product [Lactuca saligna]